MDKRFWAVIGVVVVIFGGILVASNKSSDNSGSSSSTKATSHIEGKADSSVKLVEYGDYECPVCETYYQIMQQVQEKYNSTVAFQFRNLPLTQIHPNAFAGARAAEAADLQGKFWEMHDLLYNSSNWSEWSTSSNSLPYLKGYAQQLGLNMDKFNKDFSSSAVNKRINADIAAFNKTGEQMATPAFFINGKYYANKNFVDASSGTPSLEAFSKVLDKALADAAKK